MRWWNSQWLRWRSQVLSIPGIQREGNGGRGANVRSAITKVGHHPQLHDKRERQSEEHVEYKREICKGSGNISKRDDDGAAFSTADHCPHRQFQIGARRCEKTLSEALFQFAITENVSEDGHDGRLRLKKKKKEEAHFALCLIINDPRTAS